MTKIKKEEEIKAEINAIVKSEVVKIDGESKTKIEYADGTIAYRSL